MSEKHLTEPPWRALLAKYKLKDNGLQKALQNYGRVDATKNPQAASDALGEIEDLAAKLRKGNAIKEIGSYLDEVSKEAAKTEKMLAASAKHEEEHEQEPEGTDIKSRLINALRKVKTAGEGHSVAFVACMASPCYGILLAKSATETIGPTHTKFLSELTNGKGTKFIKGKCLFENDAHTFVVDPMRTGLARNLKHSLKEFTGLNYKIRVRDPEGKVVADGDTDTAEVEAPSPGSETGVAAPALEPAPAAAAAGPKVTDDAAGAFTARFKALYPTLLKAIATRTPEGDKVKQGAAEAGVLAGKKDFAGANRLLDALEALSKKIATSPGTAPTPPGPQAPTVEARPAAATKPGTQPAAAAAAAPPANKEQEAVKAEIEATQRLIDDLKNNPQKGKITTDIAAAEAELTKAKDFATAGKFKEARAAIATAKAKAAAGKQTADKYAEYATKRAAAETLIYSLGGLGVQDFVDEMTDRMTAADAAVAAAKPDFAKAIGLVEKVRKELAAWFKKICVDDQKPRVKKLKASAAATFVPDDIKEIESLLADVESDINSGLWRKALLERARLSELIGIASRVADRRQVFDVQRAAARKAIDGLKAHPALAGKIAELEKLLEQADGLADRKSLSIEAGVTQVKEIQANCATLLAGAKDADGYLAERKVVEKKLAALSGQPAAASLGQVLSGIQQELARAATLAADGPSQDWKAARAVIAQATLDLAGADKLAEKAKELQDTAAGKNDAAAVKKAVAKLRKEAEALGKGEPGKLAKSELDRIKTSLDDAETQAAGGHVADAAAPLKAAADLLGTVQVMQQQHANFLKIRKALEDRSNALQKLPTAASNKAKIEAIGTALADADAQDKAGAWDKLTAAIGKAQESANEAEEMARLRKAFDERAKQVADRLKAATKGAKLKDAEGKEIQSDLTSAGAQADKFTFEAANRLLDSAEARFEAVEVNRLANKTPPDARLLAASAKKIMAKGGGKLLDSLVKQLPDTVPFEVLKALAKERFGLELKSDEGEATKSGQKIWEMLAKVPDDVVGNPSLKKVERQDPDKNGGFYDSDEELVVMKGRPDKDFQDFGSKIATELPDNVEDDCKPADEDTVDYFDFATLHEVGHSVDENVQFMESRQGKEEFGGWRAYGGKVDAIAAAVAKWTGYDSTPEQKKYVLDLILGNEATPPTTSPDKQADWDAALQKVTDWYTLATNEKIWWSQSDSAKIAIDGTIYHEAYKRTWVSYASKARSQGITGYQFRAPGEWFAELYASYRIGKLKKSHPAVKWLSSIKI